VDTPSSYQRYSRIRVQVNKSTRDTRPESYHLDIESIEQLGVLQTANNWEQRRAVIEPLLSRSIEDLQDQNEAKGTSLGVIRPKEITRFLIQETSSDWSSEELGKLGQQELFALREISQLEKIPFRFAYEFMCDDPRCHGHNMQIFDWEVAQAYRRWRQGKTRTEWEQMFRKEFDYKVRQAYDSLLFLGTLAAHPKTWIIGGIFFAPKERPLPTLW